MTQMKLVVKQKQYGGIENRLAAAKREGRQRDGSELGSSSSSEPVYMERRSNMVLP